MKPHRLHVQLERELAVVVGVVELDVDLELEAVRLLHRPQRLEGDTGQVELDVEFLYGVPWHRQVVLMHPLLTVVETKSDHK